MSNLATIVKKKSQYDLSDLVLRGNDKDIQTIYRRAMKKAAKEQEKILKQAKNLEQ